MGQSNKPRDCYAIRRLSDNKMFRVPSHRYSEIGVPEGFEYAKGVYNSKDGSLMRRYWRLPVYDPEGVLL